MSLFAIPGLIVYLPLAGAVSDAVGTQASILALVPVSVAAGVILASASGYVAEDIEAVRRESLSRVVSSVGQQPDEEQDAEARARAARPARLVGGERRPADRAVASTKERNGEEGGRYG